MSDSYKHWRLEEDDARIMWAYLDKENASTNTIHQAVLVELDDIIQKKIRQSSLKGLIITSGKSKGFVAGADIEFVSKFANAEEVQAFIQLGHDVFGRLEKLAIPTVAMINGFCMGGGLELALACDYRVADDDTNTRLGLPEVNIGIHPGWGGMVRLPRLIGAIKALDMILTGRPIRAKVAKRMGILDACVPTRQLKHAAVYFIQNKPKKHQASFLEKLTNMKMLRVILAKVMRAKLEKKISKRQYPSPYAALSTWENYGVSSKALHMEVKSIVKMAITDTAKNLIRVFFLQDRLKNLAKQTNYKVNHVHVIGAGVMGGDIAAWCALRGLTVTLQDREAKLIGPAIARAYQLFQKKLKDPRQVNAAMDRLIPDVSGDGLAKADVIIEAIVENIVAKQGLFKEIEQRAKPDAILATNTSSIPLDTINDILKQPERLVGIHYFNPVAKMPLVEIVKGDKTSEDVCQRALAFVGQIGKLPLPVKSSPGFLVNRILMPYLMEAVSLLEEGVPPEIVDRAAKAFGMPMGPIELADTVGLDICLSVANNLTKHFSGSVPSSLKQKVENGILGRKSGKGYYAYKKGKIVKTKISEQYDKQKIEDMQERLILRMINETVCCLREEVVCDEDLLDAGMIFGTGFAPFRGGPIHYAKDRGILLIVEKLQALQKQYGGRFEADAAWQSIDATPSNV